MNTRFNPTIMINNVSRTGLIGKSPISLGRYTYGFENVQIRQWNEGASLTIGSFCSIASNITIYLGGNHRTDWITTFPFGHIFRDELGGDEIQGHPSTNGNVIIGNDVWIGSNVTIMSGITIGDGAVLATNGVVTRDVSPYEVVGGNPARHIKFRFDSDLIEVLTTLKWWDLPIEVIKEVSPLLCSRPSEGIIRHINLILKNYIHNHAKI